MGVGRRRAWRRVLAATAALVALLLGAFVVNGTSTAWRTPEQGVTAARAQRETGGVVRVLAYNTAKCEAYEGLTFRDAAAVRDCLREIAGVLRAERPDLVFLSEVVFECGPEPVNQVVELARATGMHAWLFGENYRWGLPLYRLRSGNAVLSRFALHALETQALPGQTSFLNPLGNRRLPWAEVELDGERLLVGSIRNDSFDLDNNLVQVRAILRRMGRREALLAGDFNAEQGTPPMRALQASGRFSGAFDGPPTFPADAPTEAIDYVLAPRSWTLLEHHVTQAGPSDHLPVVSTFRLPD